MPDYSTIPERRCQVRFSASGVSDASACSPNCAADLTPQATRYPTTHRVVGYGFREAARGQVPTDKKTNTTRKGWYLFLVRQMGLLPAFQTRLLVLRTAQPILRRKPPAIRRRTVSSDTASEKPHAVKSRPIKKQIPPARGGICFWCGRWDLNPYACAHAPQTCLSANSSTAAHRVLYDAASKKSTPIFSFFRSFILLLPGDRSCVTISV